MGAWIETSLGNQPVTGWGTVAPRRQTVRKGGATSTPSASQSPRTLTSFLRSFLDHPAWDVPPAIPRGGAEPGGGEQGSISVRPACSHGDTLDDIPGNAFLSSIVELGGLGVGVTGQVLDVLEGHVLGEQVGHDEDAKAVGAKDIGQPGIFEPSFKHTAHGVRRQGPGGEYLLFSPGGPKQGRFLGVGRDAGRQQVRHEPAIEVVADGDFALLSSLFPKPQDAL